MQGKNGMLALFYNEALHWFSSENVKFHHHAGGNIRQLLRILKTATREEGGKKSLAEVEGGGRVSGLKKILIPMVIMKLSLVRPMIARMIMRASIWKPRTVQ